MDRVVLGRGVVAAVVDVEPQRLHLETALPRPTEHHVPVRVRDLAVDETLHHAIGTARRVQLHVRLDAVPAPVTEGGDVGIPEDDVPGASGYVAVQREGVEADPGHLVGIVGPGRDSVVGIERREHQPRRPAGGAGGGWAPAVAVVRVETSEPRELAPVAVGDAEAFGEAKVVADPHLLRLGAEMGAGVPMERRAPVLATGDGRDDPWADVTGAGCRGPESGVEHTSGAAGEVFVEPRFG